MTSSTSDRFRSKKNHDVIKKSATEPRWHFPVLRHLGSWLKSGYRFENLNLNPNFKFKCPMRLYIVFYIFLYVLFLLRIFIFYAVFWYLSPMSIKMKSSFFFKNVRTGFFVLLGFVMVVAHLHGVVSLELLALPETIGFLVFRRFLVLEC
jgi:hypothetical protein